MDQQDKQLEDLRTQWQTMKLDNERLVDANRRLSQQLSAQRASDRQRTLARRYRVTGLVALVMLPLLAFQLHHVAEVPVWICVLYAVLGIVMGALNLWFSVYVGDKDFISRPTCEALEHVRKVLLWQARLRTAGMTIAFVVLAPLFAHFASLERNVELLVSTGIGLVCGLAIGLTVYRRNRRLAHRMLDDMEE